MKANECENIPDDKAYVDSVMSRLPGKLLQVFLDPTWKLHSKELVSSCAEFEDNLLKTCNCLRCYQSFQSQISALTSQKSMGLICQYE